MTATAIVASLLLLESPLAHAQSARIASDFEI
jgi:hypothetical protein